jgi:hypothetical protein
MYDEQGNYIGPEVEAADAADAAADGDAAEGEAAEGEAAEGEAEGPVEAGDDANGEQPTAE